MTFYGLWRVEISLLLLFADAAVSVVAQEPSIGDATLMLEWVSVEINWPSDTQRTNALEDGTYVIERNLISGIKVYKGEVYVTIPRWFWLSGVPITLARLIEVEGQPKVEPFPNWSSQKQGNCQALQYVWSMEIDPNSGMMYVIDQGIVGTGPGTPTLKLCPAKIVVYDLETSLEVDRYILPDDILSLNDIVLDYVGGRVKFAYISGVTEGGIHVYNFAERTSYDVSDPTMLYDQVGDGTTITVNGIDYDFPTNINGIAMASDFSHVFYCPLGSVNLYRIPTKTLRNENSRLEDGNLGITLVGTKVSQSDGIAFGNTHLFYGALSMNAVYAWDAGRDAENQQADLGTVVIETQTQLVRDDELMQWPISFGFDGEGWLWFVANRDQLFFTGTMDFSGADGANIRIWKVFVNQTSYLQGADERTRQTNHVF